MKICIIAWEKSLEYGSSATHVWEVAKNLSKLGNEIHMIVPEMNISVSVSDLYLHFIKRHTIPIPYRIQFAINSAFRCLKLSKRFNFDVIYSRSLQNTIALIPISKLCKRRLILETNGIWSDERTICMKGRKKDLKRNILRFLEIFVAKNVDGIRAVTLGIKDDFVKRGIEKEKIWVIGNGANVDLFKPMDQKEVREELKLDQDANYICFVGALYPWQGVEYLVQSAPLIFKKNPNARFLIVGDGQMKKELVKLAEKTGVSDNFIFTGTVPYEEVPKYINASDVCVVPKKPLKSGYSPLKLYEYMACGKLVVASNLPGFEILEQNNAGILVEPENPDELAKAIIKLLKDEKIREDMGKNGREYVVKNHSWEVVAKRVAEVCESAVREHKNKRR